MRRSRSTPFLLVGSLFAAVGACSAATSPLGKGDDFVNDTENEDQASPQQGEDAAVEDAFARVDLGYEVPDSYAPYAWCSQCACPEGTYCFGGGSGSTTFSGTCAAGPTAGGGLAIGCMPIPPACAGDAGCDCLIEAVQSAAGITCAPVCSTTRRIVYCPKP